MSDNSLMNRMNPEESKEESTSSLFDRVAAHIAKKESLGHGGYEARHIPKKGQKASSARGKYQFLMNSPSTKVWEKAAGLSGPKDWVIDPKDTPEEKQRKAANQELLMKTAYEMDYKAGVKKIQAIDPNISEEEAIALQHFQGLSNALKYAKTKQEPNDPNNMKIKDYLKDLKTMPTPDKKPITEPKEEPIDFNTDKDESLLNKKIIKNMNLRGN